MNIKICFVTTTSLSIESFIMPCVQELQTRGFDVTFVTSCEKGFFDRCPSNVEIIDFTVKRGFDFIGTLKAAKKFKNLCIEKKFDMVVYATPNGALYGSIGSKAAGVPCRVLAQWGMRYVGFNGIKRYIIRNIEKISCRNATDVRNVSEKNRQLAIKDSMYKPDKCKVLGDGGTIGVDLTLYDLDKTPQYRTEIRNKYNISDNELVYAFVGRICRDKGVEELKTAFELVLNENSHCRLMLIGGLDDNSNLSQACLDSLNNNSQITLCGAVPNKEVSKYLSAADVLVHPTYREGFGMVLQEAAALALPTITNDIPGASEAIVNNVTGVLAKKQDVQSLKDAMLVMFDPEVRKHYGINGRKRIEEKFERKMMINRICDDYIDIYKKRAVNNK